MSLEKQIRASRWLVLLA